MNKFDQSYNSIMAGLINEAEHEGEKKGSTLGTLAKVGLGAAALGGLGYAGSKGLLGKTVQSGINTAAGKVKGLFNKPSVKPPVKLPGGLRQHAGGAVTSGPPASPQATSSAKPTIVPGNISAAGSGQLGSGITPTAGGLSQPPKMPSASQAVTAELPAGVKPKAVTGELPAGDKIKAVTAPLPAEVKPQAGTTVKTTQVNRRTSGMTAGKNAGLFKSKINAINAGQGN